MNKKAQNQLVRINNKINNRKSTCHAATCWQARGRAKNDRPLIGGQKKASSPDSILQPINIKASDTETNERSSKAKETQSDI